MHIKKKFYISQKPTNQAGGFLHFFKNLNKTLFIFLFAGFAYGADLDIEKIVNEVKSQNKDILFFHHIPGCPYCAAMIEENFKDEALMHEIQENFIYVDIYTKTDGEIKYKDFKGSYKDFSTYVGAFAYPATTFMNANGEIIHRAIGYRNIGEHYAEIKYVSSKSYKTMDLDAYKIELEFKKD